jgi:uncharacterized protein (DUF1778 family)
LCETFFATGLRRSLVIAVARRILGGSWVADLPYDGRTTGDRVVLEVITLANLETRRRSRRLELRATPEESDLIDRAAAVAGTDRTTFVVTNAVEAARRVLADRTLFELDEEAVAEWEAINRRKARDLPGLRRLMERPSAFDG